MIKGLKSAETYALIWKDTPEGERQELNAFAEFYASDLSFRRFFASPQLTAEQKKQSIQKGLKNHVSTATIDRLLFLEKQGHLDLLPEIIAHMQKRKRALLVSAEPLSEEMTSMIRNHFEKLTSSTLQLEQKIDPRLIGGFLIRIGSKVYDNTIKNSLNLLKQQLGKAPCH